MSTNPTQTVERTPWRESVHTQIWNVTELARADKGANMDNPQDDASLAVWLVHAPWMALAWHWHYCGLVHLRNLPGQSKPPSLEFSEATHEFLSLAVDPKTPPDLTAARWTQIRFLSPVSIVQQFAAANDAEALGRVEERLALVARGELTLESDGRSAWRRLLTGNAPFSL